MGSVLGCASAGRPPLLGPPREQPPSLVGRWESEPGAAHSPAEARRWLVLLADGRQWTERGPEGAGVKVGERDSPVAWWWVYRAAAGAPDRLCLHWRGGRHRADCAAYQLDTVQLGGRPVARLRWTTEEWHAKR